MDALFFVTENWLADNTRLVDHGEISLPSSYRLTPAARDLLNQRNIRVRFQDDRGSVFIASGSGDALERVHPLTGRGGHAIAHCQMCRQVVSHKTEVMTHLDAETLVLKNDPRIVFRGRVDSAIAQAILIQTQWQAESHHAPAQKMLADIRMALGNVLRCEVLGEAMAGVVAGELDESQIHEYSHHPLKHLGHDHVVPSIDHGVDVARLNILRAAIREAELAGVQAFIAHDLTLSRADLLKALNRLSSAVYVLMLMTLVREKRDSQS